MTRALAVLAAAGAVLVGAAGVGATAVAVAATDWRPVAETGTPGRLVLGTGPAPLTLPHPTRGDDVTWQVRTRVTEPAPVTLDLHLNGARAAAPGAPSALVDPAEGVVVTVSTCDRAWADPTGHPDCTGQGAPVVGPVRVSDWVGVRSVRIPDPGRDGTVYLLVRLSLADPSAAPPPAAAVGLGITARGGTSGGPVGSDPHGAPDAGGAPTVLALTGGGFAGPVLVALAAVLSGVALRLRTRTPPARRRGRP
ncbi:hypothetical protein DEJ21_05125 [Curtobacterium sp. MCSS17_006]|uniref:hypothetical protein n=1 Tax=Curtobacterium sp. MCSS17_006 TaxID=2175642 RepID=UPI000DA70ED7|nr:hypothetical protein [Curtobacterium sp. MCSS17_006]PZE39032.1 hypothetical protein DEJ21_05125 [Curtobacterium sp. MCSS17_006]